MIISTGSVFAPVFCLLSLTGVPAERADLDTAFCCEVDAGDVKSVAARRASVVDRRRRVDVGLDLSRAFELKGALPFLAGGVGEPWR